MISGIRSSMIIALRALTKGFEHNVLADVAAHCLHHYWVVEIDFLSEYLLFEKLSKLWNEVCELGGEFDPLCYFICVV